MAPDRILLTILHTNDMHSNLEAMSRLSAYAKQAAPPTRG